MRLHVLSRLDHIDGDERDVILLGHGNALPLANLGEQLVQQFSRWTRLIVMDDLFKLVFAEGMAEGILRLDDAIGVKEEAVTWESGHVVKRVVGVREHSE